MMRIGEYYAALMSPHLIMELEKCEFEGVTDFLFFMVIHQNKPKIATDFPVLNSVSFFEKVRPFMEQHESVSPYFDNDSTGQKFSQSIRKYFDERILMVDPRNKQKIRLRLRFR